MASDGIWEAVDLLGVLVKYESLSIQHFSYQDGKPNISQVLINWEYQRFGNFTDSKLISQIFSDCGLHNDKYTKYSSCKNCVNRASYRSLFLIVANYDSFPFASSIRCCGWSSPPGIDAQLLTYPLVSSTRPWTAPGFWFPDGGSRYRHRNSRSFFL